MPRKKKETVQDFTLKFTGKMSILLEVEGHGPIQWRVDDMDTVLKVAKIVLDKTDHRMTVDSYDKRDENTFKKILDF